MANVRGLFTPLPLLKLHSALLLCYNIFHSGIVRFTPVKLKIYRHIYGRGGDTTPPQKLFLVSPLASGGE